MIIFFDFDDVLMDTRAFKREYFKIFSTFGIPAKRARAIYMEMRKTLGRDDPRVHIRLLKEKYPRLPVSAVERSLYKIRAQSRRFVFKDAAGALNRLQKEAGRLELISSGDKRVQKKKILESGLARFFKKIHLVSTDKKGNTIKKILANRRGPLVFIDDKKEAVDDVRKVIPKARIIQVLRHRDQERSKRADVVITNLKRVTQYIYASS